jgi:NAD+ kinase
LPCADRKEFYSYRNGNQQKLRLWNIDQPDLENIEFIITIGGDGTVLLAAWLFQEIVPPIIPFNFGSLGFLTIFRAENMEGTISSILNKNEV